MKKFVVGILLREVELDDGFSHPCLERWQVRVSSLQSIMEFVRTHWRIELQPSCWISCISNSGDEKVEVGHEDGR